MNTIYKLIHNLLPQLSHREKENLYDELRTELKKDKDDMRDLHEPRKSTSVIEVPCLENQ